VGGSLIVAMFSHSYENRCSIGIDGCHGSRRFDSA
jgi:hypothetical protein